MNNPSTMTRTEGSIGISLKQLKRKLYTAQFWMDKANRLVYGLDMRTAANDAYKYYTLAFTVERDRKLEYLELAIGSFVVVRDILSMCVEQNIIHFPKRKPKKDAEGNEIPQSPEDAVGTAEVEIFSLVARIDNEMCKWRASLSKGKTLRE